MNCRNRVSFGGVGQDVPSTRCMLLRNPTSPLKTISMRSASICNGVLILPLSTIAQYLSTASRLCRRQVYLSPSIDLLADHGKKIGSTPRPAGRIDLKELRPARAQSVCAVLPRPSFWIAVIGFCYSESI